MLCLTMDQWINVSAAIAQFGAVAVALFLAMYGEWLRSIIRRPKLSLEIPEHNPVRTRYGNSGPDVRFISIRVKNDGNETAGAVELYVQWIKKVDKGNLVLVGMETLHNLQAAGGGLAKTIYPELDAHFDLGHLTDPKLRDAFRQDDAKAGISSSTASFAVEFTTRPSMKDHILAPGTYRICLVAAAKNAKLCRRVLQLEFDGYWVLDEEVMKQRGIRIGWV